MRLRDGMVLYHGSYAAVQYPDLAKCAPGKDFGRGFYLTSGEEQARRFIRTSLKKARGVGAVSAGQTHGYVSSFRLNGAEGLSVFEFRTADVEWLRYVASNRRPEIAQRLMAEAQVGPDGADVIVGKIANDTTNAVITTCLNGLYGGIETESAANIAIGMLLPNRLKDQLCFRTERALGCLVLEDVTRNDVR